MRSASVAIGFALAVGISLSANADCGPAAITPTPPPTVSPTNADTSPDAVLASKIDAAVNQCAAKYVQHVITTHADAVICATGPMTQAFQEASFPDMDLVFDLESAILTSAAKLDHSQITESDFRTDIAQAFLHLRAEEVNRNARRTQEAETTEQVRIDQQEAATQQQQALTAQEEQQAYMRRQAAVQALNQIMENQALINQRNYEAAIAAFSQLHSQPPSNMRNCTTVFTLGIASTNCY